VRRRIGIGSLAAVLLVSGVMVGVSSGGTEAITQPSTIVLTEVEGTGIVPAVLRADGKETGIMLMTEGRLEDADGNRVGTFRIVCTGFEGGHANMCTRVDSIKPGPYTERGLISSVGLFRGAVRDIYTVTGGSGAYDNVRGDAAERCTRKGCTFTLDLIP
jgi:hypothetical protein